MTISHLLDQCCGYLQRLQPDRKNLSEKERQDLRGRLRPLVDLVREWHRHMEAKPYAPNFYQRARELFPGDTRTVAWLGLLQEVAQRHNQDAVDNILALGTSGISWALASGTTKTVDHPDFGLAFLWVFTDRIERRLASQRSQPSNAPAPTSTTNGNGRKPIMMMRFTDDGQLELMHRKPGQPPVSATITRRQLKALLITLYSDAYQRLNNGWDEHIWDVIWNGRGGPEETPVYEPYRKGTKPDGRDDGVNERLRRLVADANQELIRQLQTTPVGGWITRQPGNYKSQKRYELSHQVDWQQHSCEKAAANQHVWDPANLDTYHRTAGHRKSKPLAPDEDDD